MLSANAVQSITEALKKLFPASHGADEAFEELGRLAQDDEKEIKMTFSDAILAMKQGKKVRLPWWGGYWYIANGTLRIHCADDKDFNAFSEENTEPLYTLTFMSANCWEILPELTSDKERNMSNKKPPLGTKPAWMVAWSRIGELIEAIERQYESHNGNAKLCEAWAEEIKLQCEIIETMKLHE